MEIEAIDHIGIAVRSIEERLSSWERFFGAKARAIEALEHRGVKVCHLEFPASPAVELVEPLDKESAVAKFLAERGEGIHHFCFKVKDIETALAELKQKGAELIQEAPQKGAGGSRIAFIHPRSLGGVLIELTEE
jgi:methylmalonyl-CoA/ethylmalonyl-CoA epimerase